MSLENAILELAAAMRYLADSNRRDLASSAALIEKSTKVVEATEQVAEKATGKKAEAEDAEIEQAVQKVEEAAKEEQAEAVELDYTKDVRPVLLAVNKKAGQPALKALLTQFGAATGDKLTVDQYADVLVEANKILAA